jgi:hypothetical protein
MQTFPESDPYDADLRRQNAQTRGHAFNGAGVAPGQSRVRVGNPGVVAGLAAGVVREIMGVITQQSRTRRRRGRVGLGFPLRHAF